MLPEEAIEFLSPAEAIAQRPVSRFARSTLHLAAAALAVAAVWASFATVEEIVYAHGKIKNVERTVVIQPLETSIIREIHVREGQRVTRGQALVTLDPTFTGADLAQNESRWRSLASQQRRIEAELTGKPFKAEEPADVAQAELYAERRRNHESRLRSLDSVMARARAELETTRRSAELLTERQTTATDVERMQEDLFDKKVGSRLKLLSSRDQRLAVEHDLAQAKDRLQELRHTLATATADRESFLREWQQKLNEERVTVDRDLGQALESLEKALHRNELAVLTAPADGIVLEVAKRSISSVVREAEQLVTIMPQDAHVEVEAQIDSSEVGLVAIGTPARVKVDTFPYQKFGTLNGTVSVVSMDSFNRETSNGATPGKDGAYFFSTHLTLGSERLRFPGTAAPLRPGMTVTAEIIIGRRSIMSYLLRPLVETVDESLHEP